MALEPAPRCATTPLFSRIRGRFVAGMEALKARRALAFDAFPGAVFLLDREGAIVDMNVEGKELMDGLAEGGDDEGLGRRELQRILARGATCDMGPAPLRLLVGKRPMYYDLRFRDAQAGSFRLAALIDIGLWKRIVADKDHELKEALRAASRTTVTCARCGAVKLDSGAWIRPEASAARCSQERTSHGLCPDCMAKEIANLECALHEAF